MSSLVTESPILTVPDGAQLGPKPDEINIRLGTFVDVVITSTLNGIPIDQFVLAGLQQTLSNKFFDDTTCRFVDTADPTKRLGFDITGTTGTTTMLSTIQTADRVLTLPDATDVLVARNTSDTMTNKTITGNTNSIDASGLLTTTGTVSVLAGAPIAGYILTATSPTTAVWAVNGGGGGGGGGPPFDDATFVINDVVDPSIGLAFNVAGTTGTSTTITTAQTVNRIYTIPDSGANTQFVMAAGAQTITGTKTIGDLVITGTLNTQPVANIVYTTAVQTLTNKTLTAPIIATIVNTGTLTLPTATDTLVARTTADTLTNKNLSDTTTFIVDNTTPSIRIGFNAAGTAATTTTITSSQTVDRVITLPNATDTLVGLATTDTFTNKTITAATNTVHANALKTTGTAVTVSAAAPPTTGQVLTATSATTATWQASGVSTVFTDTAFAVTDAVDATKQVKFDVIGTTGTTTTLATTSTVNRTLTLPDVTDTLIARTTTDTLTNKNLSDSTTFIVDNTTPSIRIGFNANGTAATTTTITSSQTASRTLTLPDATDTFAVLALAQTLTNKTIVGATNTIDASALQTTGASVNVSAGAPPTTGQVLTATSATTATWQTNAAAPTVFTDTAFAVTDTVDATKQVVFDVIGLGGTTTTLATTSTVNRTLTIPDATDTLIGRDTADTLTNKNLSSTTTFITDVTTPTRRITFNPNGNANTTTTIQTAPAANVNLILPNISDVLVGRTTTDSLTNKSLSDSTTFIFRVSTPSVRIGWNAGGTAGTTLTLSSAQSANRTLTFPDATDTLVSAAVAQTLSNKNLSDATTFVVDSTTPSIRIGFNATGTAATTTTLTCAQTANRTITFPDATDTVAVIAATQTLTNKTLTGATNTIEASAVRTTGAAVVVSAAAPPTTGQVLTATSATTATWQAVAAGGSVFADNAFAVQDNTDATKQFKIDCVGTTGTTTTVTTSQTANRTLTLPDVTDTIVARTTTDTLTNKNLSDSTTFIVDNTTPTIRIGFNAAGTAATTTTITSSQTANRTLTMPDATDTFAVLAAAQTFTNKTITGATNTVDASALRTTGAAVNVSGASPPSIGYVLTASSSTTATWQPSAFPPYSDALFAVFADADPTAQVLFQVNGSSGTTATIRTSNTANRTYFIPEVGGNANFIMSVGAQTVSDKRLVDSTTTIVNGGDQTIRIGFSASGTTSTATFIQSSQTTDRILVMPDADDTFAVLALAQTFTNKTITGSTNTVHASALRTTGAAVVVSGAAPPTVGQVLTATSATTATWQAAGGGGGPPFLDSTFVVQDSVDTTKQFRLNVAGTTGTTATIATAQVANRTYTIPDSGVNADFVMTDGTQSINGFKTFTGRHIFARFDTSDPLSNLWLGSGSGNGTLTGTNNVGVGINCLSAATTGTYNVGIGSTSLTSVTTGFYNIGLGLGSGSSLTTGNENIAMGTSSLGICVSGEGNIALGRLSLINATNSNNIAVGFQTAEAITSGNNNIAIGERTLSSVNAVGAPTPTNTNSNLTVVGSNSATGATGNELIIFGSNNFNGQTVAPFNFATGSTNVIVGRNILPSNATSSANNVLIGTSMGTSLTATNFSNNVLIGRNVLNIATTSSNNCIVGNLTASGITTGSQNIIFGGGNAANLTTVSGHTIVGYNNLNGPTTQVSGCIIVGTNNYNSTATTGTNNTNIFVGTGMAPVATSASGNIGIGANGGAGSVYAAITTGASNISIGDSSCAALTTGANNTVIGALSLIIATTATNNTAVGSAVLGSLISGTQNVGIGYNTASKLTGNNNVCVGAVAGNLFTSGAGNVTVGFNSASPQPGASTVNTNSNNVMIGTQLGIGNTGTGLYMIGYNNFGSQAVGPFGVASGSDNIAFGHDIVSSSIARTVATNIFIGSTIAIAATSANNNVAIGHATAGALTSGTNNVIVGCNAGSLITTGSFNVMVGDDAEINAAFTNCVALGYGTSVTFGSNTVSLGNGGTTRLEAQVALTVLSDARYKTNIEDLLIGTEFIKALKPKRYELKNSNVPRYGFLAQDIEEVMVEQEIIPPFDKKTNLEHSILSYNVNADKYSMSYEGLMAPMIKMMQEMQARIEALEAALAAK